MPNDCFRFVTASISRRLKKFLVSPRCDLSCWDFGGIRKSKSLIIIFAGEDAPIPQGGWPILPSGGERNDFHLAGLGVTHTKYRKRRSK